MADHSHIEWTDATWNPVTGCTLVSEGCRHCYAARLAATRLAHHPSRAGLARLTADGTAKFTGEVRLNEAWLTDPLRWRRPRRVFVAAHGDLFHEAVPDAWIDRVFAVMALAPRHTYQVLTKRPERMRDHIAAGPGRVGDAIQPMRTDTQPVGPVPHLDGGERWWPLPNVWLGVSVEDQAAADQRIPPLLATPAAVRFVSYEPALGPVDFRSVWTHCPTHDFASGFCIGACPDRRRIDWIICGGESGPGARPMHPDWARAARDQCAAAGVAFFFKQWGEWHPDPPISTFSNIAHVWADGRSCAYRDLGKPPYTRRAGDGHMTTARVGKARAGRLLDGVLHDAMPEARRG